MVALWVPSNDGNSSTGAIEFTICNELIRMGRRSFMSFHGWNGYILLL